MLLGQLEVLDVRAGHEVVVVLDLVSIFLLVCIALIECTLEVRGKIAHFHKVRIVLKVYGGTPFIFLIGTSDIPKDIIYVQVLFRVNEFPAFQRGSAFIKYPWNELFLCTSSMTNCSAGNPSCL